MLFPNHTYAFGDWLRGYKATADTLVCALSYLVLFLRSESLERLSDKILTPLLRRQTLWSVTPK